VCIHSCQCVYVCVLCACACVGAWVLAYECVHALTGNARLTVDVFPGDDVVGAGVVSDDVVGDGVVGDGVAGPGVVARPRPPNGCRTTEGSASASWSREVYIVRNEFAPNSNKKTQTIGTQEQRRI